MSPAFLTEGEPGFEEAVGAFNTGLDNVPAAVVICRTADEVAQSVRRARESGLRVTARGSGHGAGACSSLEETLLIRTCVLNRVEADRDSETVTFGAGALAREVVGCADAAGLEVAAGFSPTVGLTGFLTGGGLGWHSRRVGFSCGAIREVEFVDVEGRIRRISGDDEDLLVAFRGGGTAFGVITEITIDSPAGGRRYHGGALYWPMEDAAEPFGVWHEVVESFPAEVTAVARFLRLPDIEEVARDLRGRAWFAVESVSSGTAEEHDRLLGPLRNLKPRIDTYGVVDPQQLCKLHGDPERPGPFGGSHLLVDDVDQAVMEGVLAACGAESGSELIAVDIRRLGGAIASESEHPISLAPVTESYLAFGVGAAADPESSLKRKRDLEAMAGAFGSQRSRRLLANFCEEPEAAERFFEPERLSWLRGLARREDPEGIFLPSLNLGSDEHVWD